MPGSPHGRPGGPVGRGRPMHPITPLRPETATPVTDPGRRHATKPTRSDRQREEQEGRLLLRRREEEAVIAVNKEITISEGVTVKELAEKMGIKANLVIKKLVDRKIFANRRLRRLRPQAQNRAAQPSRSAGHRVGGAFA